LVAPNAVRRRPQLRGFLHAGLTAAAYFAAPLASCLARTAGSCDTREVAMLRTV
jgi:hypothetical protein